MGSVREDVCSDPMVVVSSQASEKTKELWFLHGHPHSKKYSNPSLVTLGALVRHNARVYKDDVAFLYPTTTTAAGYDRMSWCDFDQVTEDVAAFYGKQLEVELAESKKSGKQPTVALLGSGVTIEYFITELALQKLNVRVLLLAETIAVDALHHLLKICEAKAIIAGSKSIDSYSGQIPKLKLVEDVAKLGRATQDGVMAIAFEDENAWERHSFVMHTSGSTGMPKPVTHTNRSIMLIARMYRLFPDFYSENWYLLFPLYHVAGISIALSGLPNGQILSFPPRTWPPSSSAVFTGFKILARMGYPVDLIHCAPVLIENFYEHIMETTNDFSLLSSLKALQPGGAALAPEIIKGLVANGVNVKTTYGSTEIGPPFRSMPHTKDNHKCYSFRNLYPDNPLIEMQEIADGLYECIVHKGFELAAELWTNSDEPYRTNDLFIQEPPGSGFYVLQGRKDDILVHSNGENTSAGPLQLDIQTACKVIHRCIALGHSRPVVSLLVEVNDAYDPSSSETEEEIWQCIKATNDKFPGHSRIMRSMIVILPKEKYLPVTPKGNVKRKLAEELYIREVDGLYNQFSNSDTETGQNGHLVPLRDYIRALVSEIAHIPASEIKDWTTFYELGLDSRDALSLRASLSKRVGKLSLGTIFEHASVNQLAAFFERKEKAIESESKAQEIKRMIEKYCSEMKTWPARSPKQYEKPDGEVVLLTGGTGSLGTALIEILTKNTKVKKIIAMVRGEGQESKLSKALTDRGIDAGKIFASGKVEAVHYSMPDPLLGLDIDTYYRLVNEVTVVIQNAWKVDFNLPVEQFQDDCIRNTMNLLRFCTAGRPKQMAFTSSISTAMGSGMKAVNVPETPLGDDSTVALTTGYAQSKYIIERVTQTAADHLSIPIRLLRVGQLCGSTISGLWNTSEMWPIMFSTSVSIKALPLLPSKTVDWIPVNVAAQVISDIIFDSSSVAYSVHNIVNPNPISWKALVEILGKTLGLEVVGIKEWVERLQEHGEREQVVGMKLLDMFEGMVVDDKPSKIFETEETKKISPALKNCPAVGPVWINSYVEQWKIHRFI